EEYFPHMAQAICASDETIARQPDLVRRFVRASLKGLKDIMDDPNAAAEAFAQHVPQWQGK
ncbi:MAG: ABC transporter substrate-binding protein, partial [Actinobacteria bacterium]|nr:ABC transporter substrate-binding protein [Actinomycetota bacterium]